MAHGSRDFGTSIASAGSRAAWALGLALLGAVFAAPAAAFQDIPIAEQRAGLTDTRWGAFVGCWEPAAGQQEEEAGLLCVRPADLGVEMFTISDGEIRTSDLLIGDGEPRPIRAEGCEGSEAVSFSEDGRRAFTESRYTCEGIEQASTGVLALVSPTEWVDVRALEVEGERTSWVQRYRLVGPERARAEGVEDPGFGMETAARAARFVAHRGVGFGAVEEAARRVDAEALEGWLANRDEGFNPSADDIARLADAGVPESVIDVMVAKSFPETFAVDAEGAAEREARSRDARPIRSARRTMYFGPRMPFGFRMGYGYGYVPIGASYYGSGYGYPGYWGYRPGTVIIERRSPEAAGRIVRGRGYTRGSSGDGGGAAVPRTPGASGDRPATSPPRRPSADSQPDREDPPRTRTARPRRPPPGG